MIPFKSCSVLHDAGQLWTVVSSPGFKAKSKKPCEGKAMSLKNEAPKTLI